MPPEGRRKKKYEQELRRVQNRNFFAALVLIAAVVASVFLALWVLVGAKPKIYVSVNRVDHSGTREIPFSDESCSMVSQAFEDHLKCVPGEIRQLDEENSKLELDSSISSPDVLVVYLNGHLVTKPGEEEVYWIGPESDRLRERKLSELLSSVNASPAKTKIVLLDAGRYTWTPGFPGREPNQFQSTLVDQLKSDQWGKDLWVITSHSDFEISNVSTPLQCSLFAKAVLETLSSLRGGSDEIPVPQLFEEIKKRTQSYSRNFNSKSLQNPVLIRGGVGEVAPTDFAIVSSEIEPLRVMWNKKTIVDDSETPALPPDQTYPLSDFARDSEKYSDWLYQTDHYAALPNQTIRSLERFIELGESSLDWPTSDEESVDLYSRNFGQTRQSPAGPPTDFDLEKLKEKQDQIKRFQNALLELSVLIRLRNQMRFWDDNAYNDVPELPPRLADPIQLSDDRLKLAAAAPPSIADWLKKWEDFRGDNERDLFPIIYLKAQKNEPLSPLQAELVGVLTQRYLKLIRSRPSDEEAAKAQSIPDEVTISFNIEMKGLFNPANQAIETDGYKKVVQESISETALFRGSNATPASDTSLRYQLGAVGSEFVVSFDGQIPNIAWTKIPLKIEIAPITQAPVYKVNPYEMIPIEFKLMTSAVDEINLKIEATGDKLEGLNFGFNSEFKPEDILADLDPTDEKHRKQKTIKVYFQYPQFDPAKVKSPFSFLITATDRNDPAISDKIPITIEITKEPTYWLTSKRILAKKNDDRKTQLFHWGTKLIGKDWQPLVIRTLGNVKSKFELDLQNNSIVPRSFNVKLFKIKKLPIGIDDTLLRADRDDWKQARNFSQWLAGQSLKSGEYFELIAESSVDALAPEATTSIELNLPQPQNPEEKKPEPNARVQVEIDLGALLVFYAADKRDVPEWFQLVQFQPRDSANVAEDNDPLLLKPQIDDVFGAGIKLENYLAPLLAEPPNQIPAARLTIVSQTALIENKHEFEDLKLEELVNGARFSPGEGPALLLLDVLGVSNYATYELNGDSLAKTSLRKRLTGIRVIESPEGWTFNPRSWSFAAATRTAAPFEWLAEDANEVIEIFIRTEKPGDQPKPANEDLKLEVFLPFQNDDTLSLKQDDFWYRWKDQKLRLLYPNHRQHFLEITGKGPLTAWSRITSHAFSISDPANKVLEIGQGEKTLGRWKFVTETLNTSPSIDANRNNSTNSIADLKTVQIDVDVRKIKPVVTSSQVALNLNGKPVKEITDFLADHADGSGKYQFTLYDLIAAINEPIPEKETDMEIEVVVVDFFGKSTPRSTMITVAPKPVPKPPPKPVTLVINLTMGENKANLFSFDRVILNKSGKANEANKKEIPLDRVTSFNGGQVKITGNKQNATLTIEGLLPDTYDLTVTAKVKPPGQSQASPRTSSKTKIKVVEGEPPVTLEFSAD